MQEKETKMKKYRMIFNLDVTMNESQSMDELEGF